VPASILEPGPLPEATRFRRASLAI
jgi:hypothetical protein